MIRAIEVLLKDAFVGGAADDLLPLGELASVTSQLHQVDRSCAPTIEAFPLPENLTLSLTA
jgi:hypothetical protein